MPPCDEPEYRLEIVASMLNISCQTIRRYERKGLVTSVSSRRQKVYSEQAMVRLRRIVSVLSLGVNLSGAEVICNLLERLENQQQEVDALREQVQRLLAD